MKKTTGLHENRIFFARFSKLNFPVSSMLDQVVDASFKQLTNNTIGLAIHCDPANKK